MELYFCITNYWGYVLYSLYWVEVEWNIYSINDSIYINKRNYSNYIANYSNLVCFIYLQHIFIWVVVRMMKKNIRNYIFALTGFTLLIGLLPFLTLQSHFYIHDNDIGIEINLHLISSLILFLLICFIIIYNYIHVLRLFY